jgi:subtilisin-like proprotein convertase family protein
MKNLKGVLAVLTVGIALGGGQPASAALYNFSNSGGGTLYTGGGSSLNQVIPDNTPAGAAYSINFATTGLSINNISVTLNLSGGYNGDIYAYLSHGSQIAVLLNPITGAASSSGFNNVTLTEATGSDINTVSGKAGQPLPAGNYMASSLTTFNSTDPNGNWTIFFADLSAGDTSTLTGFSIGITAVPEPVNVALAVFGGLLGVGSGVCWRRQCRADLY